MAVDMRLPTFRSDSRSVSLFDRKGSKDLVVPGDVITTDTGFMRFVAISNLYTYGDGWSC